MIVIWMLRALVAGTLLGVGALVVERVIDWVGGSRRWPWILAMFGSIMLPGLAFVYPGALPGSGIGGAISSYPTAPDAGTFRELIRLPGLVLPSDAVLPGKEWVHSLSLVLIFSWIAASAVLSATFVMTFVRLRAIRRRSVLHEVDGGPVLVTDHAGPMVLGLARPWVAIPRWVLDASEEERSMIVRHEREHIAGGDVWVLALATAAVTLFPWHLPLWWQHRHLRLAVEVDCDARVLARGISRRIYAQILIRTAGGSSFLPALSPGWGRPAPLLERRVLAMTARRPHWAWLRSLPLAATAFGLLAVACDIVDPSTPDVVAVQSPVLQQQPESVVVQSPGLRVPVVHTVADLERKPELTNKGEVAGTMQRLYPSPLRDAGIGATVMVQFVIAPTGSVDPASVQVVHASHRGFVDATIESVERMQFRPGVYQGEEVGVMIQMPITWQP